MQVEVHPAADVFPMMNDEHFSALKADIKEHGQQESIVYWKGLLVDGRNRLKACRELGIEPEESELEEDIDPVPYIISANLHRRHLTTAQRSMVAAKLANLTREDNLKRGSKTPEAPNGASGESIDDAAKILQVSARSVDRAKHVVANGSKDLVKAVESGDVNLNQALKLVKAKPDKREQSKIIREGKDAVKKAVLSPKKKTVKKTKPTREIPEVEAPAGWDERWDDRDDYDYPVVRAFMHADYRLNTLRCILDTLKSHERKAVIDWLTN